MLGVTLSPLVHMCATLGYIEVYSSKRTEVRRTVTEKPWALEGFQHLPSDEIFWDCLCGENYLGSI